MLRHSSISRPGQLSGFALHPDVCCSRQLVHGLQVRSSGRSIIRFRADGRGISRGTLRMSGLGVAIQLGATVLARVPDEVLAYPNTAQIQIGDELVIGGEYFRIAYFTTPDSGMPSPNTFFKPGRRRDFQLWWMVIPRTRWLS